MTFFIRNGRYFLKIGEIKGEKKYIAVECEKLTFKEQFNLVLFKMH